MRFPTTFALYLIAAVTVATSAKKGGPQKGRPHAPSSTYTPSSVHVSSGDPVLTGYVLACLLREEWMRTYRVYTCVDHCDCDSSGILICHEETGMIAYL